MILSSKNLGTFFYNVYTQFNWSFPTTPNSFILLCATFFRYNILRSDVCVGFFF